MDKHVTFREDSNVIDSIDKLAYTQGINRSGFIRSCLRRELKRLRKE